jgi:hypothetical protein
MIIASEQEESLKLVFDIFGLNLHLKIDRYNQRCNGVILFMPSAKSDRYIDLYPYFPRQSWSSMLSDYCVVYLNDPGDFPERTGGSWFFNKKISLLPAISNIIKDIFRTPSQSFFVYGSSMGGYGGLILGVLLKARGVVAESPQLDLREYKPFQSLVGNFLDPAILESAWIDVFHFLREASFNEEMQIRLLYNVGDVIHIAYLSNAIRDPVNKTLISSFKKNKFFVEISNIHDTFGHVNLDKVQGVNYLTRMIKAK